MTAVDPVYLVGAGASIGALLRHATTQYVGAVSADRTFPYGIFTVNVVGSFVLALVTFLGADETVLLAVGTGACGAYTTFSSFSVDTIQLWEDGYRVLAVWYAAGNLLGSLVGIGIAAALAGLVA